MAVTYSFDAEQPVIRVKVSGILTKEDVINYFEKLSADPECPKNAVEIVDFTEASDFTLQIQHVKAITERFQPTRASQSIVATVFLCPSAVTYGMGRMFQTFHEITNSEHSVLLSRTEEELWELLEHTPWTTS